MGALARLASKDALTRKLMHELAEHFGWRPWREMAVDRPDVRVGHDINEPTRNDCEEAAKDLLAIIAEYADELAKEATEHPMAQVYAKGAIAALKNEKG